ncbi:hypothetical protein SporoP37_00200 [Sporosarcina sp. P37]|uniref:hypothetical protein n=1 Tax=unclassified Sporosarcina TaxID=2647733 RepID=UPI000A179B23|nr:MULTISPECIES: hypothetical protein [unclassified Sporosarcina]ARK23262.1 hypothetical protein SporoP37_00200 [Sporosarcina sp. P37]PID19513.1 hypothetical protein CSV62_03150 [Sporosarcina sp. P35]
MMLLFLAILIFVILFAREIKTFIAFFVLYIIGLALWDYWWGKAIVVTFITLFIAGLILQAYEKISKVLGPNKKALQKKRENAFEYVMTDCFEEIHSSGDIKSYKEWLRNPKSQPHIENWFLENIDAF